MRKFEALLGDVRRGVFLPDSTRSGRFATEGPGCVTEPRESVEFRAGEIMGPASAAIAPTPEPTFAFPPSPPPQLDDSLVPLPVPDLFGQVQSFDDKDSAWLEEREWYAGAEPEASECEPNHDQDFEPGAGVDRPGAGESESSSSSDSSSSESVDERVQASGERASELEHRKLNECLLYRHRTTRTVPRVASCVAESGIKQFLSRFVGVWVLLPSSASSVTKEGLSVTLVPSIMPLKLPLRGHGYRRHLMNDRGNPGGILGVTSVRLSTGSSVMYGGCDLGDLL